MKEKGRRGRGHKRLLQSSTKTGVVVSCVVFAHAYLQLGCVSHTCANIETYVWGHSEINIRVNERGVEESSGWRHAATRGNLCRRWSDRIRVLNKQDSRRYLKKMYFLALCEVTKFTISGIILLRIECVRLPLERYVHWRSGSKTLTLVAIHSILATAKETNGDWKTALEKNIPSRFLREHDAVQRDINAEQRVRGLQCKDTR
ncbi:unnamed protein product [Mesocestoides corti]|uniref:SAM-dependent MTase TRM10-type domain-containing protein n=1 Tax=Mesocestoides corti TaxID=53468 RepID=A0A0R3UBU2_MESCO|nr:unnamed protein product [Mesocestoides corti]